MTKVEIEANDLLTLSKVMLSWLVEKNTAEADWQVNRNAFNRIVDILAKARREGIPFGPNDIR